MITGLGQDKTISHQQLEVMPSVRYEPSLFPPGVNKEMNSPLASGIGVTIAHTQNRIIQLQHLKLMGKAKQEEKKHSYATT